MKGPEGREIEYARGMGTEPVCYPKDYYGSKEAVCRVILSVDNNDDLLAGTYKFIVDYEDGSRKIHKIKLITFYNPYED